MHIIRIRPLFRRWKTAACFEVHPKIQSRKSATCDLRTLPQVVSRSVAVALLVTGLVGFLVFIFLEVSFLAVIQIVRMVTLAFVHALLVSFVFRVVRFVVLVLEEWSCHGLDRASTDSHPRRYRENPGAES